MNEWDEHMMVEHQCTDTCRYFYDRTLSVQTDSSWYAQGKALGEHFKRLREERLQTTPQQHCYACGSPRVDVRGNGYAVCSRCLRPGKFK